jgi:hypothetical protein
MMFLAGLMVNGQTAIFISLGSLQTTDADALGEACAALEALEGLRKRKAGEAWQWSRCQ